MALLWSHLWFRLFLALQRPLCAREVLQIVDVDGVPGRHDEPDLVVVEARVEGDLVHVVDVDRAIRSVGRRHVLAPHGEFLHIAWDFKIGWNNQLWFLETLICLYIVFPLLKLAFDNSRKVFLFFLTVCAICTFGNTILDELATVARACLTDNTGLVGFNFFGGINLFTGIKGYAFVYFCAGGLVHEKLDLIEKIPATKRLVVSIATIAISMTLLTLWGGYASFLSGKLWDNVYSAYDTIFTFAMTLSLFAICLSYKGKHRAINKIVMTISKNTLGIFILHYPVKVIFRLACPQLFATGTIFCTLPGSLIYALIILAISLVLTLLLKKIPLIRKLV